MARNPTSAANTSDTSSAPSGDTGGTAATGVPTGAAAPTTATAAVDTSGVQAPAGGSDARKKMVNNPLATPPYSTQIPRADLIRTLWTGGQHTRSQITAILNDERVNPDRNPDNSVKKVPYQIVFAATRGVAGGPPANQPAAPATVAPSPAAPTETTVPGATS
jgi:hypothetical protein